MRRRTPVGDSQAALFVVAGGGRRRMDAYRGEQPRRREGISNGRQFVDFPRTLLCVRLIITTTSSSSPRHPHHHHDTLIIALSPPPGPSATSLSRKPSLLAPAAWELQSRHERQTAIGGRCGFTPWLLRHAVSSLGMCVCVGVRLAVGPMVVAVGVILDVRQRSGEK